MKTKPVIVTDMNGRDVPADLFLCPTCTNAGFSIFMVEGKHHHLQCCQCMESFCDGSCAALDEQVAK